MSIAELDDRRDYGREVGGPGGGGDDRVPPQDVHAEQSVLGSMMLSKDAIADCVETLRGLDFYRPAHETIYEAIIDLYGRGEPADAITVADELTKRGEIQRIGGQAYLHQLIDAVPTAANAGYYAEIVQERAVLRRLVDAGTRIVQMGYGQGGDVEDIVNAAQAEVYQVADKRGGEDYIAVGEVLEATIDEIEHASGKNGEMVGVPTGFTELDQLTNGLHPGQMIVIAARPAVGKALALDTPLVTPTGWTTMGEVQVGDEVVGAGGRPTRVVAATEVMTDRPCYEVAFSDGSTIVADAQHQWVTSADGDEQVRTTEEIAGSYDAGGAQHLVRSRRDEAEWTIVRLSAVTSVPVRCIQVDNDDHLYLAGRSMIPTHNSTLALDIARSAAIHNQQATVLFSLEMSKTEITMRLLSAEASIQLQKLRKGELADDDWTKIARTTGRLSEAPFFIDDSPNMSLMEIRAKCRRLKQRNNLKLVVIDYLQLMSSGKRVESRQQEVSEFSRALKLLAKEIEVPVIALSQLNRGPEQRTDKKPMVSDLRESGCLTADSRVLRADTGAETTMGELHASGARDVPVWSLDESLRYVKRHLTHVFPTGTKPVFRLTLASGKTIRATENHPFLTYDGWRPLGDLRTGDLVGVAQHTPAPESWVPWGGDPSALAAAALAGAAVPVGVFGAPKDEIRSVLREIAAVAGACELADDRPGGVIRLALGDRGVRDQVAVLLLRFGITVMDVGDQLVVDDMDSQRRFLQEIGLDDEGASRLLDIVRDRSGSADALHDESGAWTAVASALETNSLEQDADMVVLLHRESMYEKESPREGEADVIVAKHRNGPTGTIVVAFQGHYSRFTNMATNF